MSQRKRLVTMHDVARHAYVSLGTVSRVLNHHANVDVALRERVLTSARSLGYVHHTQHTRGNSPATAIASSTIPHRLACVCYRSEQNCYGIHPSLSFSLLLQGVEEEARQHDWSLLTSFFANTIDEQAQLLSFLADSHVEALLLVAFPASVLQTLLPEIVVPAVLVGHYDDVPVLDSVMEDDYQGMFNLTRHLLEHGHRQIAYAGPTTSYPWRSRYEGYQLALRYSDLQWQERDLLSCPSSVEGGRSAGMAALEHLSAYTAVVCSDDLVALGLMQVLAEGGRIVPQDLSVVSYDDLEAASLVTPRMTTMRSHTSEVGRMAVVKALQRVKYPSFPFTRTIVQAELVRRNSVRSLL